MDAKVSEAALELIRSCAAEAAQDGCGSIVEIGNDRNVVTAALICGLQDVGRGKVVSIDPQVAAGETRAGLPSSLDRRTSGDGLDCSDQWIEHRCTSAETVAKDWSRAIDLLLMGGARSYSTVSSDIQRWIPFIRDHGIVIFDNAEPNSEVAEAIRDHLPFSQYIRVEQVDELLVLSKLSKPRTLYLCGGLQSSGSTLVSWCFLQRRDLDGVLDMENSSIQQDFSRVQTESVWLKMTIGAFRLAELTELYLAQGWDVKPILINRDLRDVYYSLKGKAYAFNGVTGDEPPLFVRIQRYQADLDAARINDWPILEYGKLIGDPKKELGRICAAIDLPWDEAMMNWPKDESSIAYGQNGNETFNHSRQSGSGMLKALETFQRRKPSGVPQETSFLSAMVGSIDEEVSARPGVEASSVGRKITLPSSKYRGTQRHLLLNENIYLREENNRLKNIENKYFRIRNHIVFGPLMSAWRRVINKSFPAMEKNNS